MLKKKPCKSKMSRQEELKVLKDISEDQSVMFGQYLSQLVTMDLENAELISNAFDQFLANERQIPPPLKLQIALAFEESFKHIAEGLQ